MKNNPFDSVLYRDLDDKIVPQYWDNESEEWKLLDKKTLKMMVEEVVSEEITELKIKKLVKNILEQSERRSKN